MKKFIAIGFLVAWTLLFSGCNSTKNVNQENDIGMNINQCEKGCDLASIRVFFLSHILCNKSNT